LPEINESTLKLDTKTPNYYIGSLPDSFVIYTYDLTHSFTSVTYALGPNTLHVRTMSVHVTRVKYTYRVGHKKPSPYMSANYYVFQE